MAMTPDMKEAIARVSAELQKMSQEEFRAMLDAHKPGDIATALIDIQETSGLPLGPAEPSPQQGTT